MKRTLAAAASIVVVTLATTLAAQAARYTYPLDAYFSFTYPAIPALSVRTISVGTSSSAKSWSRMSDVPGGRVFAEATLSSAFQPKTNFADGLFSVGVSEDPRAVATCLKPPPGAGPIGHAIINGVAFTTSTTGDAGAGNLYEVHSYRTLRKHRCYAVEYVIHSLNIGNFDPSSGIVAYNQNKVTSIFDAMVRSFKFR